MYASIHDVTYELPLFLYTWSTHKGIGGEKSNTQCYEHLNAVKREHLFFDNKMLQEEILIHRLITRVAFHAPPPQEVHNESSFEIHVNNYMNLIDYWKSRSEFEERAGEYVRNTLCAKCNVRSKLQWNGAQICV